MKQLFAILACLTLLVVAAPPSARAQSGPDTKRLVQVPLSDSPSYAKRALVVGVDDYTIAHPLTACGNDARAFADLLRTKFGFDHVTLMTDAPDTPKSLVPTGSNLRHQLRLLTDGIIADRTDLVLFYSGHGTRTHDAASGDADWLVPEDGDPGDIAHSCVNYTEFKTTLDTDRPARALLVIDACRDLYSGKGVTGSGFGVGKVALGPQVAELLSCQPTQVSQEGLASDFSQSVFTHFLLKGLAGDPDATADEAHTTVTFDSLKLYVQGQVSQYVSDKFNAAQVPDGRATLGGMVLAKVVAPPPVTVATVVPPPVVVPAPVAPTVVLPSVTPTVVAPPTVAAGRTKVNPKDGAEMVYVPAGAFPMGDDDSFQGRNPRHTVILSGYYIYKNDVTVAMYRAFCEATGRGMPDAPSWGWKDDHPMVNVSWDDAQAYCAWAGVRLPTDAQWEKAARGTDGRKYPWGNDWDTSKLWCSKAAVGDAGSTSPTGSFPEGASPYGCLDMAGNVWNWCSDWYADSYWKSDHGADPSGPGFGTHRVLRGCSWYFNFTLNFRASYRYNDPPSSRDDYSGFRGASGL